MVDGYELSAERFRIASPLRVFPIPGSVRRLNLVTDSINEGSLFGGVATAIFFSALLAERWGCDLRVITRTEKAKEANFEQVISQNAIPFKQRVTFEFANIHSGSAEVGVTDGDIFLTTSWWTTASVLASISARRVIYLLQEDERMFYSYGDEHLRCVQVLQNKELSFVLNTKLLFDHLKKEGFEGVARNGIYFEPSFDANCFNFSPVRSSGQKKNFFFYARPNNPRNLFLMGIEVLDQAVARKILNPEEWNIYFVGKDIPRLRLGGEVLPIMKSNLSWQQYGELMRTIDLGLSLMYTPHPSYPPLDLAASGAVVVTNSYGLKTDLSRYSTNILCKPLDIESLLEGLREGVALANDLDLRRSNYERNGLSRQWSDSFSEVYQWIEQRCANVLV